MQFVKCYSLSQNVAILAFTFFSQKFWPLKDFISRNHKIGWKQKSLIVYWYVYFETKWIIELIQPNELGLHLVMYNIYFCNKIKLLNL